LLGGAVVVGVLGVVLLYGKLGAWVVEHRVVPRLEAKLGRKVTVGAVEVHRGKVELRDIVVPDDQGAPLVSIAKVTVQLAYWPSLRGRVELGEAVADGLKVALVRRADGDNFAALLAKLRGDDAAAAAPTGRTPSPRPTALVVKSGEVELRDERDGVTVRASGLTARLDPEADANAKVAELAVETAMGPHAKLTEVAVTATVADPVGTALVVIGGGELELWRAMALTGVAGSIAQGKRPGTLEIALSGGYAGVEGTLWKMRGWLDPKARQGSLRLEGDRFTFDRLAPVLQGSPVIDFDKTSADGVLEISLDGDVAKVNGEAELVGLNLFHPKLAEQPMRGLGGRVTLSARYDHAARAVDLDEARFATGGVDYILTGRIQDTGERKPGDAWLVNRRVAARLRIPSVPCQTMLRSIPPELVPSMQGFKLQGQFATDVELELDWKDLEAAKLDGSVGIRGCKVVDVPPEMKLKRLLEGFDHEVEVAEGVFTTIRIGPESDDFVPLAEVSPHLINSLMTTEDSSFYKHKGFITREFRTALIKDLQAGYFKYGASSITMQTVKNVFLDRQKTLGRKFQELFLTWYIEEVLEKERILEIYLNAIEYGPGLYGIKPAALQYFGKLPKDLNPTEAAFFSSILPAPKVRYVQFCKDKVSSWTNNKIQRILELMVKRERLSLPEFEVAMATPLVFQPSKKPFCTKKWSSGAPSAGARR
jgi:hypothetical protein